MCFVSARREAVLGKVKGARLYWRPMVRATDIWCQIKPVIQAMTRVVRL